MKLKGFRMKKLLKNLKTKFFDTKNLRKILENGLVEKLINNFEETISKMKDTLLKTVDNMQETTYKKLNKHKQQYTSPGLGS